ncbi:cache domain-containing protein [Candidatus Poriferisodalis sp.]|uniref:cache domain-containing protein n=1 Tax=Candidatus Poriferisodalis sp. TaxID=3101277 RepID=UPI003B0286C4
MNRSLVAVVIALLGGVSLIGCSSETDSATDGLSRSDVEQIVQAELADALAGESDVLRGEIDRAVREALEAAAASATGLAAADVEAAVEAALAETAPPQQGVTPAQIEEMIRQVMASTPARSEPAAYTKTVVEGAISRYEADGLEATVEHYSSPESVDGQWYVFIIDDNDTVIAHYNPDLLGLDVNGPVGTDINGYSYGPEMLAATEAGRWVPYVYVNPASGTLGDEAAFELKHTWVVRHDGLLFGSGWYIDTDEFVPQLISESAEHFRAGGFEAIIEFYTNPQGISVGLVPMVEYYNRTDTLDGFFSGFTAAPDGEILTHIDPELVGTDITDLLGPAVHNATAEGVWITAEDNPADAPGPATMRIWVMDVDGTLIGAGWYKPSGG